VHECRRPPAGGDGAAPLFRLMFSRSAHTSRAHGRRSTLNSRGMRRRQSACSASLLTRWPPGAKNSYERPLPFREPASQPNEAGYFSRCNRGVNHFLVTTALRSQHGSTRRSRGPSCKRAGRAVTHCGTRRPHRGARRHTPRDATPAPWGTTSHTVGRDARTVGRTVTHRGTRRPHRGARRHTPWDVTPAPWGTTSHTVGRDARTVGRDVRHCGTRGPHRGARRHTPWDRHSRSAFRRVQSVRA